MNDFCTQCGSIIHKDAKFCGKCGAKLTIIEGKKKHIHKQQDSSVQPDQKVERPSVEINESIEQENRVIQKFISFVTESMKSPIGQSRKVTEADLTSVVIVQVLFSLTLSLIIYLMSTHFTNTFLGLGDIPFIFAVVTLFFFMLLLLTTFTWVIYGVLRLMRVVTSYKQVIVRLGVFSVISVVLLLSAILLFFITAITFSLILSVAAIGLFVISSYLTIFLVKEDSGVGLDGFYGMILTTITISIIFLIIRDSSIGNIIKEVLLL
jgi:hypothetical protein